MVVSMPTRPADPATPSRREQQRASSVARIVTAAEDLMSESKQFSDISAGQVISRSGVSRSTFYSYFDDMGHLLRTVGHSVVGEVVDAARKWMDLDTGITEDRLMSIFNGLIATYRRRATLLAALADASTYDAGVREEFHNLLSTGHTELAKHIRRAQAAGAARAELDPEAGAAWLVWMIERGLYQQIRRAPAADVNRHAEALASIVWHAIYLDPA
jgi:TetR/AcrR family transcriptional regulator, ethionamide resistance regulator